MDANEFIAIIKRRQAKFQAQRRTGPQEHMDETARVITEEYDALLAEIESARSSAQAAEGAAKEPAVGVNPGGERANEKAEAEILGNQGQSGG